MSEQKSNPLTIGQLAKMASVSVETIRFYQRKHLIPTPPKPYGSIRRYSLEDVKRVRFIKSAQKLGFSLAEIANLLRLEDGTHCAEAKAIAESKLISIRQKIADLKTLEKILESYTSNCENKTNNTPCPIISNLFNDPFV